MGWHQVYKCQLEGSTGRNFTLKQILSQITNSSVVHAGSKGYFRRKKRKMFNGENNNPITDADIDRDDGPKRGGKIFTTKKYILFVQS